MSNQRSIITLTTSQGDIQKLAARARTLELSKFITIGFLSGTLRFTQRDMPHFYFSVFHLLEREPFEMSVFSDSIDFLCKFRIVPL